jgi:glutamine synthetase
MLTRDVTSLDGAFIDRYGIWSDEDVRRAFQLQQQVEQSEIEVIRLSFADQHGLLRGKTVVVNELPGILRHGCNIVSSLLLKDTSDRTVFPVFTAGTGLWLRDFEGAADVVMVPDPTTFRVLPWAPKTAWLLCDLYFADGKPVPFSTRFLYKQALSRLGAAGFDFVAGLEVEFHLFKIENPHLQPSDAGQPGQPPEVSLLAQGYRYMSESRYDQVDEILAMLRRDLQAIGLQLRSLEVEYGPSQYELTLAAATGIEPADGMMLLRSAVKQICHRHGYHATFMCRPRLPAHISAGWHLHQSLRDRRSQRNAFSTDGANGLSPIGEQYLAGLLAHARAATVFGTPTINGYKRYRSYSMAPDRVAWGRGNRGAMLRVLGAPGDPATRIENRIGEPAANPYLYMASQVLSGLAGIEQRLTPGEPVDAPYDVDAPLLPRTLSEAVEALRTDSFFRRELGDDFVEYYLGIKNAEIERFDLEVTEWEQREYFEIF